jgi:hypothetical protein
MKTRKLYLTDLSDAQWSILEPFIPSAKAGGRPETYPKREILNGIFYVVRGGITWRMRQRVGIFLYPALIMIRLPRKPFFENSRLKAVYKTTLL